MVVILIFVLNQITSGNDLHEGAQNKLTRVSLSLMVSEVIRGDILYGRLQPGVRLAQQELSERFGVSRMPIRDALRQLTFEGYLVQDVGSRCRVATLSRQDIIDTFVVEGVLHGYAARRFTERATDEELADLQARHDEMDASQDDPEKYGALNWQFHRKINYLSNSRKVVAALKTIAMTMPRDFAVEFPEWVPGSNQEHAQIVAAMIQRDGAHVEGLMQKHIGVRGLEVVHYLESKGVELV